MYGVFFFLLFLFPIYAVHTSCFLLSWSALPMDESVGWRLTVPSLHHSSLVPLPLLSPLHSFLLAPDSLLCRSSFYRYLLLMVLAGSQ